MTPTPSPSITTFTMDFLCKLIPKEFNGNRHELGQFIANCNNAYELAADQQKIALIYFILSRISGRAKEQLAQQTFKTWDELKNKLKILYQDKKHYVQIMEELNNSKQNFNENVSDYFQRLEILNSCALSAAQQYTIKQEELPGKLLMINEITLNRFIYHSSPNISQMLRWKEFENLNSACTAALAEERALNIIKSKFCRICKKNNHDTVQFCTEEHHDYRPNFLINGVRELKILVSNDNMNYVELYSKNSKNVLNKFKLLIDTGAGASLIKSNKLTPETYFNKKEKIILHGLNPNNPVETVGSCILPLKANSAIIDYATKTIQFDPLPYPIKLHFDSP
ncbi:hypothetical protein PV326_000258 [Microctonus aethiopoides]|nr:hypothetical protein PV326_000258 [Microctonus aethiopoides]